MTSTLHRYIKRADVFNGNIVDPTQFQTFRLLTSEGIFEGEINEFARDVKNRSKYPWFWQIRMQMLEVDQEGLPTQSERRILNVLFGKILSDLSRHHNVQVIGRNTIAGNHEIWIYSDMLIGGSISDLKGAYPEEENRLHNFQGAEDPNWNKVEEFIFFNYAEHNE